MGKIVWLRAETKPLERRTPLTPEQAGKLVAAGHRVVVEESELRVFPDQSYIEVGCEATGEGSWREAPDDAFVLGLKELDDEDTPLRHAHIYFAHVYKGQRGSAATLRRFVSGGGRLYDLEYLVDERSRRVAAFGYWAGYVGAALGAALTGHQRGRPAEPFPPVGPFDDRACAVDWAKEQLPDDGVPLRALVVGALGRSGSGAIDLLERVGFRVTKWDLAETKAGGPFAEILEHDLLLNCVLVNQLTPPFVTIDTLRGARRLVAISDVACDPGSAVNPLPVYDAPTTMQDPAIDLDFGEPPLALTAIDHLPSLLPLESSEDFSEQLFDHLVDLLDSGDLPPVWLRAQRTFETAIAAL
ncbi:MAG: saccharopine dehydrogenase [Myxococcota bacterium]